MDGPDDATLPPAACLTTMYAESAVTRHVDPHARFPRPAGVLAERLARSRPATAPEPCSTCSGACSLRPFVAPTR